MHVICAVHSFFNLSFQSKLGLISALEINVPQKLQPLGLRPLKYQIQYHKYQIQYIPKIPNKVPQTLDTLPPRISDTVPQIKIPNTGRYECGTKVATPLGPLKYQIQHSRYQIKYPKY